MQPLDPGSYAISVPGTEVARVTSEAEVFEYSADNQQLFSPGGQAFAAFSAVPEPAGAGEGVAWLVQENGTRGFVVQTEQGAVEVRTATELLSALERIGMPGPCPYEPSIELRVTTVA